MKRNILVLTLALVMVLSLALTGCQSSCEHEWKDANCADPKTCELCDVTEGAPLGHTWKAATCNAAKTCETCGKVEGEALGHTWTAATCEAPKTCSTCKAEDGEALGHTWVDATTETPKNCTTCQKTEGEAINVDDRFVTANCQEVFGSWSGEYTNTAEDMGLTGVDATMVYNSTMVFNSDGTCSVIDRLLLDQCKEDYIIFMAAFVYETYEAAGMDKASIDSMFASETGMTVQEYAESTIDAMTEEDLVTVTEFVYYVEDGTVYLSTDWETEMVACVYSVNGDKLNINLLDQIIELTKDAE